MLKNKIILWMLVIWSWIVWITNAFIMPINEETTFWDGTLTCDENFNCISENANWDTFNWITPSHLTRRNWFIFFNEWILSQVYWYNTLTTYYNQQKPVPICRTDYNSAINYTQTVLDYLSWCVYNTNTWNTLNWLEEDLWWKITSYTVNLYWDYAVICANYNETINSACFRANDRNDSTNYDFWITNTIFNRDNFVWFWLAWYSPFTPSWPDTEWWPISCINIKTEIMLYWNKYNTWMCYTNWLYFSWFTPIQTWKLSIFEVFPSFQDYQNMINRYNTYCHPPYTEEYCAEAMSWYEQWMNLYTNIYNANINNNVFTVEPEKLYQYCHLQLNFTEEEKRSECKDTVDNYYATWVSEDASNGNPFEWVTDRLEDNIQIAVPTTWTVFDEFLDGDTRIVGITDRYTNFKEIYHKIMWLFKYRNTQQGIIPWYITAMLMLILLLAIIKK